MYEVNVCVWHSRGPFTSQSISCTHLLLFLRLPHWAVVFLLVEDFFHFYGTAGCPALWPHPSSSGSDRWGLVEDALSSRTHAGTDKEGQRVHLWNQLGFCNFPHAKANKAVIKCINSNPQILRFIQFMRSGSLRGKCVFIWPCVHLKTTQIAFTSQQQIFQEKHLGVKHDAIQLPRNKPKSQSSQHARLLRLCSELRHFVFVLCSLEGAHV